MYNKSKEKITSYLFNYSIMTTIYHTPAKALKEIEKALKYAENLIDDSLDDPTENKKIAKKNSKIYLVIWKLIDARFFLETRSMIDGSKKATKKGYFMDLVKKLEKTL